MIPLVHAADNNLDNNTVQEHAEPQLFYLGMFNLYPKINHQNKTKIIDFFVTALSFRKLEIKWKSTSFNSSSPIYPDHVDNGPALEYKVADEILAEATASEAALEAEM